MTENKRKLSETEPDFKNNDNKIPRLSDEFSLIINREFQKEIDLKVSELDTIDDQLKKALKTLYRLKCAIVTAYYNRSELQSTNPTIEFTQINSNANTIFSTQSKPHPAVRNLIGQADVFRSFRISTRIKPERQGNERRVSSDEESVKELRRPPDIIKEKEDIVDDTPGRNERFKKKYKIIVGNISKSILDAGNNTHKWMCYVRAGDKFDLEQIIYKVRFFLHPSYIPNDIIEITDPPYHLSRRGWGEFPLRVQIHFKNNINKPIDVIHNLKLDKTLTGLETLGAETLVDVWLFTESKISSTEIEISNKIKSPMKIPLPNKNIPELIFSEQEITVRTIDEIHCYCKNNEYPNFGLITKMLFYLFKLYPLAENKTTWNDWSKIKQKYMEWYRAKYLFRLLQQYELPNFDNWSTKSIMEFGKMAGFSFDVNYSIPPVVINIPPIGGLNSYSECDKSVKELPSAEVEVNVTDLVDTEQIMKTEVELKNIWEIKNITKTVNVCLLTVAKCFVEDLLRRALLLNGGVEQIGLENVKLALLSRDEFDIFLNTDLGKIIKIN